MADQYDRMTTAQLEKSAELRGVDLSEASTNAERAELLRAADEAGSGETAGDSQPPEGAVDTPAAAPEGESGLLEPQEGQREYSQPAHAPATREDIAQSYERGFFGRNPDPTPNEEYTMTAQAAKLTVLDPTMVPAPQEEEEEES